MFVQLLKTTPYLSGQHRLDICLKKIKIQDEDHLTGDHRNDWTVTTGECHLSPLSDNIAYTDSIERPFFSQTYGENLKVLYSQLKDDFFRDVPQIKTSNILYEETEDPYSKEWVDTTDHSYTCGLKRMRLEKYGKQFSWLCPLWIEDAKVLDNLYFIMTVYGDTASRHSMKFKITLGDDIKKSLKEWLNGVSSDLLYIDIDRERATITGANPEFGTPVTSDVSYIVTQLFDRERPVMETNSTLNQLFSSNNVIARQLVNFNFCFSCEDLIPSHMIRQMEYKRWKITLDTYYLDEQIDKVDFFTNYEFIPCYCIINSEGLLRDSHNVFEYLDDNKYVDYMYANRTTQVDPYWSLVENPKYIYNFYNGFSPWYMESQDPTTGSITYKQTKGLSMNQPDVAHDQFYNQYNNIGWCEVYDLHEMSGWDGHSWNGISQHIERLCMQSQRYTHIEYGPRKVTWANGLKYDCHFDTTIRQSVPFPDGNFNIIMCLTGDDLINCPNPDIITLGGSNGLPLVYCIMVPTENMTKTEILDRLTVRSIISSPPVFLNYPVVSNFLTYVMPKLVWPTKVVFRKSICPIQAESPEPDSEEVTYIKQEYNVDSYVYRYSGALRPFFVSPEDENFYNIDHNFKKWSQKEIKTDTTGEVSKAIKKYNDYLNTGYSPVYPSIDFYSIEGTKNNHIDYFNYPQRYRNLEYEFEWFEDSRLYVLPKVIELTKGPFNREEAITENTIREWLKEYFVNTIGLFEAPKQLKNLYRYTIDYDYASETNINQQIFKVKYILR